MTSVVDSARVHALPSLCTGLVRTWGSIREASPYPIHGAISDSQESEIWHWYIRLIISPSYHLDLMRCTTVSVRYFVSHSRLHIAFWIRPTGNRVPVEFNSRCVNPRLYDKSSLDESPSTTHSSNKCYASHDPVVFDTSGVTNLDCDRSCWVKWGPGYYLCGWCFYLFC